MRILFCLFDGGGNLPPQLKVARTLRARGVEILVIGHEGVRERVEAQGFPFEPFTGVRPFSPVEQRSLPVMMADIAKVSGDRGIGRCVSEAARRHGVDAVVVDMVFVAGIAEVLESGVPTVVFVHCFYRAIQDMAAGPLGMSLRLKGITPLGAENRALHIVSARRDLDPVRGAPPVRHVGVVWQGMPSPAVPAAIPRILVSLSTCAFAGQRRMLQNILDAVEPLPVEAIVTVGPAIDASGLRVPANATMHSWLDHDEVLSTASMVVGHGGHSTAMRALSFGVPMVVMPANPLIDQKGVGSALERAGAGILLSKHARTQRISGAIETVLHDEAYRRAAATLGERIRARDGAEVAADAIEEFMRSRTPVVDRR
jgi:UDP:flavonoid glycosyltransferase YjiC (YdhE family)